ncbi:hypothetical protein GOP47_0023989 [Adiantum capillus-veneris]|uniref:Sec16 Sec23-binding domain-containing protein n=1 Tax=Adiantum capillus-veneris TaxID=13818 RepID=A0A9D4U6Q0_ADICA|nr:hypothetical protein GOP47_0023989 [Adiantum capillus-veneris]
MAAIKSVARSSNVAFGQTEPNLLALATQDGALDASFSASASLEIFKIDFSSSDSDLELLSSYTSSEKFNSIAWGTAGAGSAEQFYGLIATGQSDGTVSLWNPTSLIRKDSNTEDALVTKSQKHGGRVRGLEFNGITPNLLASGGDDGEVVIWDVVNPTAPSHFPALKGSGQDNIVDLSWNRKVQHIIATTSNTGVSMVWDLRRQKSILSFTDPNNRRPCAALEWNPEGATQLIVASADDRSPSLQVWDLRNSISPVKELVGHTKGVVAMAWCPIDSALLLSSAKDYRTVCWDTSSGEIVCELPVSSNWNFDLQWSPRIAGVLSSSSYDGRVNLYNIEACSRILPSEGAFGGTVGAGTSSAMRAPKWLKRPAGVTFGFDGKLVSFSAKKGGSLSELNIQTIIMEDDLVARSKEFEAAIEDPGNKSSLQALCDRKAQDSRSEEEREIWSFLKIMFEEQARTSLLSHLGFSLPQLEESKSEELANGADLLNSEVAGKLNVSNGEVGAVGEVSDFIGASELDGQGEIVDDGADFFNTLSTPKGAVSPQLVPQVHKEAVAESLVLQKGEHEDEVVEEDDCEQALRRALVIADFKDAVRQCLSEDRMADALVLAHVGGTELWEETLAAYFKKHRRPYQKVLAAVAAHDFGNLVNSRPLAAWRETLALLCSYAGSQEWTLLCDALAARLDAAGLSQAALLCYICAANTEELARLWYRDVLSTASSAAFAKEMQELMEKIVVLALAKGEKRVTPALSRLVGSYAELLASQGIVMAAMDYLGLVFPEESTEDLIMLRDRIGSIKQEEVQAPNYSFESYPQGVFAAPTVSAPVSVNAPSDNVFPSHNVQQTSSYGTSQPLPYYSGSGSFFEPMQGSGYPNYIPPPQESSYPQRGMFLPTPLQALDRTQPPSIYQPSFGPPSASSFTPVDPPSTGGAQAPFTSRGPPLPQPTQFLPGGSATFSSNQPSTGIGEWASGFQRPFQPTPATLFPGPTSVSTPTPRGFMPVSAPRAPLMQQQPGPVAPGMQPQSPSSLSPPRAQATPAVAAPPVTIQTVDTMKVPADLKPVIATLSRLYNETTEALGGARATHTKKREIEDNSKKLGGLFERLNKADISPNARAKLAQICQSIDTGDYATASQLQVSLTTSDWDECGSWLGPLKRMIKLRQSLR